MTSNKSGGRVKPAARKLNATGKKDIKNGGKIGKKC